MGDERFVAKYAFISYAGEDAAAVDVVQAALERAGIRVWRDVDQLWPGDDWKSVMRGAISGDALVFLACFSRASLALERSRQNEELVLALGELRQRRPGVPWLIPVRLDSCEIPDLDLGAGRTLRSLQSADLFGPDSSDALSRLVGAVTRILGAGRGPGASLAPVVLSARTVVVGDIPLRPRAFRDRPGLVEALTSGPAGGVQVVFAMTGLRGTGKTQVAAACARMRLAQGWPVVAWVDASSPDTLLAGYAELAAATGLTGDATDSRKAARQVRHWLEGGGSGCFLVLDNAVSADELRPFLPVAGAAQVIVTSSRISLAAVGTPVPVDVFTVDEAVAFLSERTGLDDDAGAAALAGQLGCLPLALTQAGAVIAGQRLSYDTYLSRLSRVTLAECLARPGEDPYPVDTAQAISLTLEAALNADQSGLGEQMLAALAVLSPAGVPRDLLASAIGAGETTADELLAHLADWSLISFSVDGTKVLAHRLVNRVARERAAAAGTLASSAGEAISALAEMLPAQEATWRHRALMQEFITQVTALAECLAGFADVVSGQMEEKLYVLLDKAGCYLLDMSDISRSVPLLEQVLAGRERALGAKDLCTVGSRNNLANAYHQAGQLDAAIRLHQQALAGLRRARGSDRQLALTVRRNLASDYLTAGRVDLAIGLYRKVLAGSHRMLGLVHPDTLASANDLAHAYLDARWLGEATSLFEQALAIRERILGPDHPDTLTSRDNLASALKSAGRLDEAIGLYQQALADRERVLGPDHPDTLISRGNLAGAYESAGRLDEALGMCRQALADFERVLGPDHPHTLTARDNLAGAYESAGHLDEAIGQYQQALADHMRVLGPDHRDTLISGNNLAYTYRQAGRRQDAIRQYQQTLAAAQRVLAHGHPLAQKIRGNLATAEEDEMPSTSGRQASADSLPIKHHGKPGIKTARRLPPGQ